MSDYKVTDTELASIANAIRTKGGTSAQLEWPSGFVSAIGDISGGGGISGEYELLDYIQSDGTQCIDLGVKCLANDIIKVIAQPLTGISGYRWVFGAEYLEGQYLGLQFNTVSNDITWYYGGGIKTLSSINYNTPTALSTNTIASDTTTNIYAFSINLSSGESSSNRLACKFYLLSIGNNYFLPCRRKSDGVCGLWDCTNAQLLTDIANGNDFVAGNVLFEFGG